MKDTGRKRPPKREEHYRINGVEVTLEELARELVRCGGITKKGSK